MQFHKSLFSAWNKQGRNPFPGEHDRRWRDGQSFRWDTWFFQATAFADFCIPLGRLLGTNFEHPSEKWEGTSLTWLSGKTLSKCLGGRTDLGGRVAMQALPRLTSATFNPVWYLFYGHSELWSKQLESLSWLSDTIYDPPFVWDLMNQWQWACRFWGGYFSEFKPLANSSLWS